MYLYLPSTRSTPALSPPHSVGIGGGGGEVEGGGAQCFQTLSVWPSHPTGDSSSQLPPFHGEGGTTARADFASAVPAPFQNSNSFCFQEGCGSPHSSGAFILSPSAFSFLPCWWLIISQYRG